MNTSDRLRVIRSSSQPTGEIGPHHEHWLAGYHAGLRAAEHATQRYLRDQLQPSGTPQDDRAPVTAATDHGPG